MAFPLEPSQLRAQQRAFYLATSENDFDSTRRIIKPLSLGLFFEDCNKLYFKGYRPLSPPIPVDLPEIAPRDTLSVPSNIAQHKRQSSRATARNIQHRRKSKSTTISKSKNLLPNANSKSDSFDFQEPSPRTESVETFRGAKKSTLRKNPLSMLFVKSDKSKPLRNDSTSTFLRSSLRGPAESFGDATDSIPTSDNFEEYYESEISDHSLTDDENYISDDLETLDNRDGSNSGSVEEESIDSAFTDIEGDSMIDGSPSMMYDYTVLDPSVLGSDSDTKKDGTEGQCDSVYNKKGMNSTSSDTGKLTPLLRRRESFTFTKISDISTQKPETKSNLSMIIQTRHTSSNANPLNYFSYGGADCADGIRKAEVDVFLPPNTTPVLTKLPIVGNMTVFDCIGYILFKLSEKDDQAGSSNFSFNPNRWRLELTDEDGELYDSTFGVLERSRLMVSYNCPKYLALCKVENEAEIASNEKQSPLPMELKQNLNLFEERSRNQKENDDNMLLVTEKLNLAAPSGRSIEVKVKNIPSTSKVITFFVAPGMLVGDLLDLICRQYQVDPTNFKLCGIQELSLKKTRNSSLLSDKSRRDNFYTIPLQNSQTLSETLVDCFKMEPTIRSMLDVKTKRSSFEAGITPNSSGFIQAGITPPMSQVESKLEELPNRGIKENKQAESKSIRPSIRSQTKETKKNTPQGTSSRVDPFISGTTSQLPTTLNTFYCKWRVFRKKAPLIYRIEKSLIIDGEYIHLAPTDDANWKTNFYDNSFSGASQSGHHHHYLHHYNYSKYYNDTILKTSSFHISQIVKLKQYKESKNPTHFKIVIQKEVESGGRETAIKKKYDLEAETLVECEEIIEKIKWALQLYSASNVM